MPKFVYKAKEGPQKVIDGVVEANSLDNAISQIIQQGLSPIDVAAAKASDVIETSQSVGKGKLRLFNRIKIADVVLFTRQMSDLVEASVPIIRALQISSRQTQNPKLKVMIEDMYESVRDGGSFSDALSRYSDTFSSLYINLVRTGEVSGKLEAVLARLAEYLDKEQDTRKKIQSSLAYPFLIVVVGIVTVFVLLTFLIPKLTVMFDDFGQELPWSTMMMISLSDVFADYWWLMVISVVILAVYLKQWLATDKGRLWLDTMLLKLPFIDQFIRTIEVGRLTRTLGTLIESGVVITTALNSVWTTIDNTILRNEIKKASEEVANGSSLNAALTHSQFFPEMAINMISVGEETGNLHKSLYKIADTYERDSDQIVKTMISLLGPMVLVIIVSVVGMILVSMLMPLFQMNLLIQ